MSKIKDISGMRFSRLTAVKPTDMRSGSSVVWECKCDCGNTCYANGTDLRAGRIKSCGCIKLGDLQGKRFGRLTAIRATDMRKGSNVVWECKCDCGRTCYVTRYNLQSGGVKSCGCLVSEDLRGKRFGKLVVVKSTDKRKHTSIVWECRCDCGNTCYVETHSLTHGLTRSCGCLTMGENITGKRFGKLIAIRPTNERFCRQVVWECKCDCGNTIRVPKNYLVSGKKKSCGCLINTKNIEGERFGKLTAIRPTKERKNGSIIWECKCDCGNTVRVPNTYLVSGVKKSCGCLINTKNIEGKRFGKLTAIKPTDERYYGRVVWECKCDCGNTIRVPRSYLVSGKKISCGRCTCATRSG